LRVGFCAHPSQSDALLTQEFLAEMLAVRHSSISVVAHTLQQARLLNYKRGRIQITDLEGLRKTAWVLPTVSKHYDTLLAFR
jgi:hypothetical protein